MVRKHKVDCSFGNNRQKHLFIVLHVLLLFSFVFICFFLSVFISFFITFRVTLPLLLIHPTEWPVIHSNLPATTSGVRIRGILPLNRAHLSLWHFIKLCVLMIGKFLWSSTNRFIFPLTTLKWDGPILNFLHFIRVGITLSFVLNTTWNTVVLIHVFSGAVPAIGIILTNPRTSPLY